MLQAATRTESTILARRLTRIYPLGDSSVVGINAVDLTIAPGELVVLKGNSGSGKSTLLALLAGLDRPTSGELVVAGHTLSGSRNDDLTGFRRDVVGMVFQSFNLLPTLTVFENVLLPALLADRPAEPARRKARRAPGLAGHDAAPRALPGAALRGRDAAHGHRAGSDQRPRAHPGR